MNSRQPSFFSSDGYSFPPANAHIHGYYGLTAVAQGGWANSNITSLSVGETSQTHRAYLYFYTGTGWQKVMDFCNSLSTQITLTPSTGFTCTTIAGSGFTNNSRVTITWDGTIIPTIPNTATTDAMGDFTAIVTVPAQTTVGTHVVNVTDELGNTATATFKVVNMTGPQGSQGSKGENGTQGLQGPQGSAGDVQELLLVIAFPTATSILAICIAVIALLKKRNTN